MAKKKTERDPLRLMQWAADGFPPIDLSQSGKDVIDLINAVNKLRKQVAYFDTDNKPEPCFKAMVNAWHEAYPLLGFKGSRDGKCINEIIAQTRQVMTGRGKEATCDAMVNSFKYVIAYVKREHHFCDGKPLTTWNQQYLSIVHEIANGKTKQKPLTTRERINNL